MCMWFTPTPKTYCFSLSLSMCPSFWQFISILEKWVGGGGETAVFIQKQTLVTVYFQSMITQISFDFSSIVVEMADF